MTTCVRNWCGLGLLLIAFASLPGCTAGVPGIGGVSFGGVGMPYGGEDGGGGFGMMPPFGYGMPFAGGEGDGWNGYRGWGEGGDD